MRKWIGILFCLLVSCQLLAVSYQPCGPMAPRSGAVYVAEQQQLVATINMQRPITTGSFASISASNFEALNSEGGACYHPAMRGPRRIDREDMEDEYGTGQINWESPIGNVPWILMVLLTGIYVFWTKKRKKVQKNLSM